MKDILERLAAVTNEQSRRDTIAIAEKKLVMLHAKDDALDPSSLTVKAIGLVKEMLSELLHARDLDSEIYEIRSVLYRID